MVAYYTELDHRLGLKPTGHAADVKFIAVARDALPDRLYPLDRVRDLHAKWGEHPPEDADGYLDLWEKLGRLLDGKPARLAAGRRPVALTAAGGLLRAPSPQGQLLAQQLL